MNRRHVLRAALVGGTGLAAATGCRSGSVAAQPPSAEVSSSAPPATPASAPTRQPLPPEVTHGPRDRPAGRPDLPWSGRPGHGHASARRDRGATRTCHGHGASAHGWPRSRRWPPASLTAATSWAITPRITSPSRISAPTRRFAEIDACAQTLRRLTGSIGRWFRPSQTQHATSTIRTQARRAGYATCLSYDLDSLDYTDPTPAAVVNNVLSQVANGSIVSMHCGHAATIAAIGPILDGLRARGLHAVTMSELVLA